MDEQIMTIDAFKAHVLKKAYIAFIRCAGADSHGMNPGAAAALDFEAEYKRLEAEAQACQQNQSTRPNRARLAANQQNIPLVRSAEV